MPQPKKNRLKLEFGWEPRMAYCSRPTGSVWTWGANSRGQLGIDSDHAFVPMRVPELSGIRDIAAGDRFTAAVRNDGTLWTWGENDYGELGDGTTKDSPKPKQVAGITGVVAVAARAQHILALRSDGTVWGWGDDPASSVIAAAARKVADFSGVVAIATSASQHPRSTKVRWHSVDLGRSWRR